MSHKCVARSVIYFAFLSDTVGHLSNILIAFVIQSYCCGVAILYIWVNSIALLSDNMTVSSRVQPADNLFNIFIFLDMWHTLSFSISSAVG